MTVVRNCPRNHSSFLCSPKMYQEGLKSRKTRSALYQKDSFFEHICDQLQRRHDTSLTVKLIFDTMNVFHFLPKTEEQWCSSFAAIMPCSRNGLWARRSLGLHNYPAINLMWVKHASIKWRSCVRKNKVDNDRGSLAACNLIVIPPMKKEMIFCIEDNFFLKLCLALL